MQINQELYKQLKAIFEKKLGRSEILTVMENALNRARQVEANNGRHLPDVIFKT